MLFRSTQYAAHQLGGITRKVTLMALPQTHITDLRIETDLDSLYKNVDLKAMVAIKNASMQTQDDLDLRITVKGLPIVLSAHIESIKAGETWIGILSGVVEDPKKWDNERPNLYEMNVELIVQKQSMEMVKRRFGFREIEIDGNQLLVNGKPVKLRGVCRHDSHPLTGRVVTLEQQRRDIELYRNANCNFIRTSHYPPTEEFIAMCDEMGMFVEVEAPICWVGHQANENWGKLSCRDSKYYPYILQANMETIHLYRNNPSVIFWSMANESYWNREFAQILEYVKKADPTRPSTFHDQAYGG